jgi:hypothetical protein
VVIVIKVRCKLNVLLLATLAVMDKFFSSYRRKDRDNGEDSSKDNRASSSIEMVCKKPKCRKYNPKYLSFVRGFCFANLLTGELHHWKYSI